MSAVPHGVAPVLTERISSKVCRVRGGGGIGGEDLRCIVQILSVGVHSAEEEAVRELARHLDLGGVVIRTRSVVPDIDYAPRCIETWQTRSLKIVQLPVRKQLLAVRSDIVRRYLDRPGQLLFNAEVVLVGKRIDHVAYHALHR